MSLAGDEVPIAVALGGATSGLSGDTAPSNGTVGRMATAPRDRARLCFPRAVLRLLMLLPFLSLALPTVANVVPLVLVSPTLDCGDSLEGDLEIRDFVEDDVRVPSISDV